MSEARRLPQVLECLLAWHSTSFPLPLLESQPVVRWWLLKGNYKLKACLLEARLLIIGLLPGATEGELALSDPPHLRGQSSGYHKLQLSGCAVRSTGACESLMCLPKEEVLFCKQESLYFFIHLLIF